MKSIRLGEYVNSGVWTGYLVYIGDEKYIWHKRDVRVCISFYVKDSMSGLLYRNPEVSNFIATLVMLGVEV